MYQSKPHCTCVGMTHLEGVACACYTMHMRSCEWSVVAWPAQTNCPQPLRFFRYPTLAHISLCRAWHLLAQLPPGGSELPAAASLRLLPPLETAKGTATSLNYFLLDDALQLYRKERPPPAASFTDTWYLDTFPLLFLTNVSSPRPQRLPLCNVDLSNGKRRSDFLGVLVENGWNALLCREVRAITPLALFCT